MAEGANTSVTLEVKGDKKLEKLMETHFEGVKAQCSNGKLTLYGTEYLVKKASESFCDVGIDIHRRQLIIAEDSTLQYLNEMLNRNNDVLFLVTDFSNVFACFPNKNRREIRVSKLRSLVEDNIVLRKFDDKSSLNLSSKFDNLLFKCPGRITFLDSESTLVFTKDIEHVVDEYIKGLEGDDSSVTVARKTYDWCIDEGCKIFIETNCPNINVQCTQTSFTLLGPNADSQIKILDLNIDVHKKQLILAEDLTRRFLNNKFQDNNIVCYLVTREEMAVGIVPSTYHYEMGRIIDVIHENVCVFKPDVQDDSVFEELLFRFHGKIVSLVQSDGTCLVYRKDIESSVISFFNKIKPDSRSDISMELSGRWEQNSNRGNPDVENVADENLTEHDDYTNEGHQRGAESKYQHNVNPEEKPRLMLANKIDESLESDGKEFESSVEVINSDEVDMDVDLVDYMLSRKKAEIARFEKHFKCTITNNKGNITVLWSNLSGQKRAVDKLNELASTLCMNSFYVEEDKFRTCQSDAFQTLVEKLRSEVTEVIVRPCIEPKIVETAAIRGINVHLVLGSAADVEKTEVIVCPFDSKLNPVCAAACHIMFKAGDTFREMCIKTASKPRTQKIEILQVFEQTGQLPVKVICGMMLRDWYEEAKNGEEKFLKKLKQCFSTAVSKNCASITIPLEVGQKVPVSVMAKICCSALKAFVLERPTSVLNKVSLCVVNDRYMSSLTEVLKAEFPINRQGPATEAVLPRSMTPSQTLPEIYGPSTVQVTLNTGSLTDQRVEAIVVPVNSRVDLKHGAISKTVLDAAGQSIQKELDQKNPQGIGPMEVTYTSPGNIPVKYILYSNLPELKDRYGPPKKSIGMLMENIFKLVKDLKITSVAFPAFGTGGLKYPEDVVAMEMMRSIYLHAPRYEVKYVNIVVFKPASMQHRIFEKVVKEYHEAVKMTRKGLMDRPSFVEIFDHSKNNRYTVVENVSEVFMCDVIIYHRRPTKPSEADKYDGEVCLRKVKPLDTGLIRDKIYLYLNNMEEDTSKLENIYQKALEYALRNRHCQFLVIDLESCKHPDETKDIILRLLKRLDLVLGKENRLAKLQFLVCRESLESCIRHAQQSTEEPSRRGSPSESFFGKTGKFLKETILGSSPDLDWRVVQSKVYSSYGAHVVVCSESEEKLQSALSAVRNKLSNNGHELDDDRKGDIERRQGGRKSTLDTPLEASDGNFKHKIQPKMSAGNHNVQQSTDVQPHRQNGRYEHQNDKSIHGPNTDTDYDEIDDRSADNVTIVKPFKDLYAVLPSSDLRHLSKHKLDLFLGLFDDKEWLTAEPVEGGAIKVTLPYDKRADLADVLKRGLTNMDRSRYYVLGVQPQTFELLKLYLQKTGIDPKEVLKYNQLEREIEIELYEDVYEQVKQKAETVDKYQTDTLDVSKTSLSVDDTLRDFNDKKDPEFEDILVEGINNNKAVNIYYPVDKQDKALKVKNSLQVKLKLIKTTRRRDRHFDDFSSLQSNAVLEKRQGESRASKDSFNPYNSSKNTMSNNTFSMPISTSTPLRQYTGPTGTTDEVLAEATYLTGKNLVIKVYKGDITKLKVDCIVNAANEALFHGAGIAAVIARAAGRELDRECRAFIQDNGTLHVNQCISTSAGNLPYAYVLHAVGPMWGMYADKQECADELMRTIYNILRRAELLKMTSVAIPSISSGIFGVPWEVCAEQYARGVHLFEEKSQGVVQEVHFIDINEKILNQIRSVFSVMFKVQTSNTGSSEEMF